MSLSDPLGKTLPRKESYGVVDQSRLNILKALSGVESLGIRELRFRLTFTGENLRYHLGILERNGLVSRVIVNRRLVRGGVMEVLSFTLTEEGKAALEYFGGNRE